MVSGLKSRDYHERLVDLGMTNLEARRREMDMVQTFKQCCGSGSGTGSVFNRVCGSGSVSGIRIRIQEGKNDPQKKENIGKSSCFEVLDGLF